MMDPKVKYSNVGTDFGEEEMEAIRRVLSEGDTLAYGPERDAFEEEFADFVGVRHAISVNSGTSALHVVSQALGLGPEDSVVTSPTTFVATAIPALEQGARVVFADIEEDTLNLHVSSLANSLRDDTRTVFVVHYGGQSADMEPILRLCAQHGIAVVEDAAQSVGARYRGIRVGSFGLAACFSFQSLKPISTLGEGGMIVTDDADLARKCRRLRNIGLDAPDGVFREENPWILYDLEQTNQWFGSNLRMGEVQAAVGRVQLRRLESLTERRRQIASTYNDAFCDEPCLRVPGTRPDRDHTYSLYSLRLAPGLESAAADFRIRLRYNYGVQFYIQGLPVYYLSAFRRLGFSRGTCPVAESCYSRMVSLPIYPRMTDGDVAAVIEGVQGALAAAKEHAVARR